MINIYTVLALYFMAAVFYVLEFKYSKTALYWGNIKGSISKEFLYLKGSSVRCLWLARLLLISAVVMCVIEQLTYIADPY